MKKANYKSYYC